MRITYCGNFTAVTALGEPFNTESHVKLSLESLGHTVDPIQEGPPDTVRGTTAERIIERLAANPPDLLLWTRTWRLPGDCRAMLRWCADRGIPTVAFHLDLYAPIKRGQSGGYEGKGVVDDPWWSCKYVVTPDGGSDAFWKRHGVNHFYLPPGVYHAECSMAQPDQAQASDVIFVGSYGYHDDYPYRPKLIDWLRTTYGSRFKLYPDNRPAIRGRALNVLYASAKVVVGDTLCPGFTHERYTSDRLPETLGRGGFLVYPRIKGITDGEMVTEGEHIAAYTYGDFDGLRRTIDYYLEHADERERIRRAGYEHAVATMTYRSRMTEMLAIIAEQEAR